MQRESAGDYADNIGYCYCSNSTRNVCKFCIYDCKQCLRSDNIFSDPDPAVEIVLDPDSNPPMFTCTRKIHVNVHAPVRLRVGVPMHECGWTP